MSSILIVDDEEFFCNLLATFLRKHNKEAITCFDADSALEVLRNREIDIALLDINLPGKDGIELLKKIRTLSPRTVVMMMTGIEEIKTVISCIRLGAEEYFVKPINHEELLLALERTEKARRMEFELTLLRDSNSDPLLGTSREMRDVQGLIDRAAESSAVTVLITGETGTGKELVARHIHNRSRRQHEPFIPVNCSSIPATLIESEFFGHEKGAFTGADRQRKGLFEKAHKGTVFLDEIGDMDVQLQTRLLRLLEDQRIYRLGGGEVKVDVHVICATNQDLAQQVEKGLFRKDLFYRINILNIHVPPLRERKDDIPQLADFFIRKYAGRDPLPTISAAARQRMLHYSWPGNVRELRNVIERELVINPAPILDFQNQLLEEQGNHAQDAAAITLRVPVGQPRSLAVMERDIIEQALNHNHNNVSRTARFLGLGRSSLRSKMQKLGIHT